MKIKINQTWSKIVKKWMTACDFLTGGQTRTNFYRWLSRKRYGRETRVYHTRTGNTFITSCKECVFSELDPGENCFLCADRYGIECESKCDPIDPACELHFRTPVLLQILPVILAYIGTLAIILTACLLYWKYR